MFISKSSCVIHLQLVRFLTSSTDIQESYIISKSIFPRVILSKGAGPCVIWHQSENELIMIKHVGIISACPYIIYKLFFPQINVKWIESVSYLGNELQQILCFWRRCVCCIVRPESRKINAFNHPDNQIISLNMECPITLKKEYFGKPFIDYWQKFKKKTFWFTPTWSEIGIKILVYLWLASHAFFSYSFLSFFSFQQCFTGVGKELL